MGDFIFVEVLQNDVYCQECYVDIYVGWVNSVYWWLLFNNLLYVVFVVEMCQVLMERDGIVQVVCFCVGCYDLVFFFSGEFDDLNYDFENVRIGQVGIICMVCYVIINVNSVCGNVDYMIEELVYYFFVFSENFGLCWVNEQLIKVKLELYKKMFFKLLYESLEFCGLCYKVYFLEEFNEYKFLCGQNYFDMYYLSGVLGYGVQSFYYLLKVEYNCLGCYMLFVDLMDFGVKNCFDNG